jgi:hypothetical protein
MYRFLLVASAASLVAFTASASNPHGDDLPVCRPSGEQPAECLLDIQNAGFDGEGSLVTWIRDFVRPEAARIVDDGNPALALERGGSVTQIVPLPISEEGGGTPAYFLPSLFLRSTGGEASVRLSVTLVARDGSHEAFSQDFSAGEAWSRPSGGFDASASQPSAMLIEIRRIDVNDRATVFVDDVQVIRQR